MFFPPHFYFAACLHYCVFILPQTTELRPANHFAIPNYSTRWHSILQNTYMHFEKMVIKIFQNFRIKF